MRVLIVANNKSGKFSPFVVEQVDSLCRLGVEFDYFGIDGKGALGYLMCLPALTQKIKEFKPNIIHAHYGLSGMLANLQRKIPVVTTFHGSDIHSSGLILRISQLVMRLSGYNIFVSDYIYKLSKYKGNNVIVQACGLDVETIKPIDHQKAREYFGWDISSTKILFSGSFSNSVKNYPLAKAAVELLGANVELIELKGYSRDEVAQLMSACDCLLLTSYREASPTVIKEAMACNLPIVATDVGDVRWVIDNTSGCYITSYEVEDCAFNIKRALEYTRKYKMVESRNRLLQLGLDVDSVALVILDIYKMMLNKKF